MNAHVNFSETASAIAINAAAITPRHEPEVTRAKAVEKPAEPTALAERADLTRALDIVQHAVDRTTIPILANARLRAAGGHLHVTATDLDMEITVAIPAAADSEFATTLPAKTLRDLLKKATASDHVAFTDHGNGVTTADFERVTYKLPALPVADFPLLDPGEFSHSFTLPGATLWAAIDATMAAMSNEETRYYLRGLYFHAFDDRRYEYDDATQGMDIASGELALRIVATDGHRLYRQDVPAPESIAGMPGIIVPRNTVTILHKLTKGKACPDIVAVELSDTRIRFTFDTVTITSKLVDGSFPDYQRVIPTGNDKPATFDPGAMIEAARAVSLISKDRFYAVKMGFECSACALSAYHPDTGSAKADVACEYDSDPLEIGFDSSYLLDAISTASPDGGDVTMTLADPGSPTLVTGSRDGWLGVIMPKRV